MDVFLGFLKIEFKKTFAYRSALFTGIFGSIFAILVQIALVSLQAFLQIFLPTLSLMQHSG